jgi:hypothetical protein
LHEGKDRRFAFVTTSPIATAMEAVVKELVHLGVVVVVVVVVVVSLL